MDNKLKELSLFCKSRQKSVYVCCCDDEQIHIICELLHNILFGGMELKGSKLIKELYEFRVILHYLSDENVSIPDKRRILCRVAKKTKLFSLIRKKILPILQRKYKKKEN